MITIPQIHRVWWKTAGNGVKATDTEFIYLIFSFIRANERVRQRWKEFKMFVPNSKNNSDRTHLSLIFNLVWSG